MFKIYGGATKFKQWTQDNKLIMDELPIGADVMFYNDPNEDDPLITEVYEIRDEEGNAIRVCDVPNIFLTETKRIKVRIPKRVRGIYGTMHSIAGQNEKYFEVEPAEKPADYVYEKTVTNTIDPKHLPEGYPYKEIGTILDGTFEFVKFNMGIYMHTITDENFTVVDGKSYTVIWDGVTFQCVATTFNGFIAIGNLAIPSIGADTGEPFLFGIFGTNKIVYTTDTAATHTITVRGEIAYPIASEFLPDEIVNKQDKLAFDSAPTTNSMNPVTSGGIKNALDKKMSIVIINAQMPSSYSWYSVTYGNGKFVAVAYNSDKVAYSEDGINWTLSTMPSSTKWSSVAYGNGKFVAIALDSDQTAYSEDGINWTASTMPSSDGWFSVTYGNGKFVAVAQNSDKAAYSEDGINWTLSTMPSSTNWYSVTYGNGKFVAVVNGSNKTAYSEDGINWTLSTMPSSGRWYSVTYGNGKFVAVAYNSDKVAYSEDGINWTLSTMPSSTKWSSVAYGNGKFVAIALDSDQTAYSEDGINWTASTMPSSDGWYYITYGNGKFVAVVYESIQAAYSEDGINWKTTFEYLSQNESDVTEIVRSIINNETIVGVPACTTADNGKVLKVVDGVPTWVEA